MLPKAGVYKDESQEEGGECEDGLNGGHRVEGVRDVRPNKEQLPNLEFIVWLVSSSRGDNYIFIFCFSPTKS